MIQNANHRADCIKATILGHEASILLTEPPLRHQNALIPSPRGRPEREASIQYMNHISSNGN